MKAPSRTGLLLAVLLLSAGAALGQSASPAPIAPDPALAQSTQAAPSTPPPAPAKPVKPLSESEKIKALPDDERKWLTEFAAPIILPEEQKVFLELSEPYQWEQFKQAFWERREQSSLPAPLGPGYRYRYQELRQLADEKYDGWRQDAGKMVLRWGEPAEIFQPKCGGDETFRDLEIWTYTNMGNSGRMSARYIFYRPQSLAPRRLWTTMVRNEEVFLPMSCRKSFDDLALDCTPRRGDVCVVCQDRCDVYGAYSEIVARQGRGAGALMELAQIFKPPDISTEGLQAMKD